MIPQYKEGDKLYVITRRDIAAGYQGVQSIHAAIQFIKEHPEMSNAWFEQSNFLAWVSVEDEPALFELLSKASRKHIKFSIFREPDVDNQVTAIALEPGELSAELCKKLPLALKEIR